MSTHEDFETVPIGLYICRMFHESEGDYVSHLMLKTSQGEWCNQPSAPVHSSSMANEHFADFWKWAEENLPTYEYPRRVKAAL